MNASDLRRITKDERLNLETPRQSLAYSPSSCVIRADQVGEGKCTRVHYLNISAWV
jgi:hypothetical protein